MSLVHHVSEAKRISATGDTKTASNRYRSTGNGMHRQRVPRSIPDFVNQHRDSTVWIAPRRIWRTPAPGNHLPGVRPPCPAVGNKGDCQFGGDSKNRLWRREAEVGLRAASLNSPLQSETGHQKAPKSCHLTDPLSAGSER
ncbi:hypothetical protein AAFF_G00118620 [Aldrovandia affinis]|uniref:Uncharacterized protein n=1 Tax=Aldrovandia affinis TaxID=143900 RepID=A0AAD7WAP4_9TELE|nr:hypothetical protein AAFF_G00118620 [Aldrovandia affinis]